MTALALEHPASIEFDDIEIPIPAGFRLASGDTLADVLKAAERIVQYIAHGPE